MIKKGAKLKILIFGGSGLIGSRISQLLGVKYQIVAPFRSQVNVADKIQVEQIIKTLKPDYIIYSAGITSVDKVEQNPKLAYLLNVQAPAFIAKAAFRYQEKREKSFRYKCSFKG